MRAGHHAGRMWNIRVDHHFHLPGRPACTPCTGLAGIGAQLTQLKGLIMSAQAQLAADILAVADKVAKVGNETRTLIAKVADLEAALAAAGDVSPEVTEAMTALHAQVAVVDELVPDAPAPQPVPEPAAL